MVGGKLKCLGTVQHLKSRFGAGYQLEMKPKPALASSDPYATALAAVKQFVIRQFPSALLEEEHSTLIKYRYLTCCFFSCMLHAVHVFTKLWDAVLLFGGWNRLADPKLSLSVVFGAIEQAKSEGLPLEEYSVSQSTLEQTFLLMARNGDSPPSDDD